MGDKRALNESLRALGDASASIGRLPSTNFESLLGTSGSLSDLVGSTNFESLLGTSGSLSDLVGSTNFESLLGTSGSLSDLVGSTDFETIVPRLDYETTVPRLDYEAIAASTAEPKEARSAATSMVAEVSAELWLHDASWAEMWDGAVCALGNRGPDFPRHVASSLRSLLWAIRDEFAPRQGDETDRARFIRLLESRSRGRLAASASSLADDLLGRLSSLAKDPKGRSDEAEAVVWLTGGLLRLLLPH